MKRRFGQHRFTGQQRLGKSWGEVHRSVVVLIVPPGKNDPPGKSDDQAGVGDTFHERENRWRQETSAGPQEALRSPPAT
jgi:hypothetical protein